MCPIMSAVAPQSCGVSALRSLAPCCSRWRRMCSGCLRGRAFMGIGVGLTAGPSTAAMVEFSGQGAANRAATITTAAQAVGFAAALLLGGALIQYTPLPTRLNFWVHGVLILSLGSQVARDLVGSPNTLVNAAALSLFAIASAVVGIGARRLQPRAAMTGGGAASALGMVLLAAAVAHH